MQQPDSSFTRLDADIAIGQVAAVVQALPVYITGSAAAAATYDNIGNSAYSDVDVFCSTPQAIIAATQRLLDAGYELDDRFARVWRRWLKSGFNKWHTNSMKVEHPSTRVDVNLVYKLVNKNPLTSLSQVLESFDFGLLSVGFDCEDMKWRDMRSYLFPDNVHPQDRKEGRLPLMPNKRENWRNGFISQYVGLREVGRYVKYRDYGYDMRYVHDDLLTGYRSVSEYLSSRTDNEEKMQLGLIYNAIAGHLENEEWDKLRSAGSEIIQLDQLDAIMEALE